MSSAARKRDVDHFEALVVNIYIPPRPGSPQFEKLSNKEKEEAINETKRQLAQALEAWGMPLHPPDED